MTINKEKCKAWCDFMLAFVRMTQDLNDMEYRYIKANFSIAYGKLELQELERNKKLKEK